MPDTKGETKDETQVFSLTCPCCEAMLWVDGETKAVLRSDKAKLSLTSQLLLFCYSKGFKDRMSCPFFD